MTISTIVGLGNPGEKYKQTRHNLGFQLMDAFAEEYGGSWRTKSSFRAEIAQVEYQGLPLLLVKPTTFMNRSGETIAALSRYYKKPMSSFIVAYDEVNIPLGQVKLSLSGSAGGHNGVGHILGLVGDGFIRYRLGIGPKVPSQIKLEDFVLGGFTRPELETIQKSLYRLKSGLCLILEKGPSLAMNQLNQRTEIYDNDSRNEK